jgi:aspartyl/asparaginyl beta-hydroxylase (cupin superfamily)
MQTMAAIDDLMQQGLRVMAAGQPDRAAQLFEQVVAAAPQHAQALFHLGQINLQRRNAAAAQDLLERAANAAPDNPVFALNLSFAWRMIGNADGELAAITRSLAADPYYFPALLAKGIFFERTGEKKKAARTYKNLMIILPADSEIPETMKAPIAHARELIGENAVALNAHLETALAGIRARHAAEKQTRFDRCKDVVLGRRKVYAPQPSLLHFPGLPGNEFFDRELFPWLTELESKTDAIREELNRVMREDAAEFTAYIDHPVDSPSRQWLELNHSARWSVFFLWKDGARYEINCSRCPVTAAAAEALPIVRIPNFGPTIMFSTLAPKTHIPPHSSVTNTRLVVHLPLIVPKGCRFRVGNEIREWQEGEAWIFDDTIEHEAWNDSDQTRVILMIDIWHPMLSEAERELIAAMLNGVKSYYGS